MEGSVIENVGIPSNVVLVLRSLSARKEGLPDEAKRWQQMNDAEYEKSGPDQAGECMAQSFLEHKAADGRRYEEEEEG